MILTAAAIERAITERRITIDPYRPEQLNPNSYNLRLAGDLLVYETYQALGEPLFVPIDDERKQILYTGRVLDMAKDNSTCQIPIPPEGLVLLPGRLYLGRTEEYTETTDLIAFIEGRSSVGRLGVSIHVTAGYGDVGFKGCWTLEITVVEPVRIYAGVEICQICYTSADGPIRPYAGKYQHDRVIRPSGLWKEFELHEGHPRPRPKAIRPAAAV